MMEEPSTPASPKTEEAAELGLGRGELDGITWERRGSGDRDHPGGWGQRWIQSNRNRGALHFLRPPLNNVRRPKLLTSLKPTERGSAGLQSGLVAVRGTDSTR